MTADSAQAQAKRPRLSIPDLSAYGRSTSDPPMSLQRRMANAADMPISVLDGRLVFPPQPQSRHLKSHNSGPARFATPLLWSFLCFLTCLPTTLVFLLLSVLPANHFGLFSAFCLACQVLWSFPAFCYACRPLFKLVTFHHHMFVFGLVAFTFVEGGVA